MWHSKILNDVLLAGKSCLVACVPRMSSASHYAWNISICQVVINTQSTGCVIRNLAEVNSFSNNIASDEVMDILNRIGYSRLAVDASVTTCLSISGSYGKS